LQKRAGKIDMRIGKRGLQAKRGLKLWNRRYGIILRESDKSEGISRLSITRIFPDSFLERRASGA